MNVWKNYLESAVEKAFFKLTDSRDLLEKKNFSFVHLCELNFRVHLFNVLKRESSDEE